MRFSYNCVGEVSFGKFTNNIEHDKTGPLLRIINANDLDEIFMFEEEIIKAIKTYPSTNMFHLD